ncbi:MAG: cobaltochelatase subunit CobN [Vicinamibacterales bacterium]
MPREFRTAVELVWGPPERSQLMTVTGADGGRSFVIPGLRLGNVFLGPQPLRTTYDRAVDLQHDTLTPPPHSYIAAYLWYRYEFMADAVVHMGRHGTLEWLPGKHVGQAGWDDSEAILGDLPNPYYFIIDGGGEAIQARRRSAGVMIGHLTPLVVGGGLQAEHQPLRDAIDGYEAANGVSPDVAEEYRRQILDAVRALKLEKQLKIDLDATPWETVFDTVAEFVRDAAEGPTPLGQATIGTAPAAHVQREGLEEFMRTAFQPEERTRLSADIRRWSDSVFEGSSPEPSSTLPKALREKAVRAIADARIWIADIRRSPAMEVEALVRVLRGGFIPSGPLGDPLRSPASIPSGRNLHDLDTALIPTKAAWEVGKRLADQQIARFKADTGRTLEKLSMVLWYGETARSRGVMEAEAMWLMGVEPRWNARNIVDSLRLVPDSELGRPRVDVLYTVSGIYRDGFGDKILWLDRAARLAASAGDNVISRHDREVKAALVKSGVPEEQAEQAATARVFGAAPGMYGVGGIEQIVSRSLDEGEEKGIADMYLHHMNHAYSEKVWGAEVGDNLTEQLKGNDALVHSRTTYVYGALDNDDFYQFAGGLNSALKAVNGVAPEFYVNNQRADGHERIESFRRFLVGELTTRYWNPKWIKEQQAAGYAGARQIIKEMEHLYGFQATSKEQVDGQLWQKSYDVYVADEHGLDMDAFFEKANPYVRQWQLARLLEVDRQGSYRFSDAERGVLIDKYVKSVVAHGAACSSNTCGNLRLHQFIAEEAGRVAGLGAEELQAFARQMTKSTHWGTQQFPNAPQAFRSGVIEGLRQAQSSTTSNSARPTPTPAPPQAPPPADLPVVTGARMEEKILRIAGAANSRPAGSALPLLAIGLLIAAGIVREWRGRMAA